MTRADVSTSDTPPKSKRRWFQYSLKSLFVLTTFVAGGFGWWYWPRYVSVVKTWSDLLDQKPIKLDNGMTVRLGVEANRYPQWSGVFLYAYVEGQMDDYFPQSTNHDRLGPTWVSVSFEGRSLDTRDSISVNNAVSPLPPDLKGLLFVRPIMVDKPGRYDIRILSESRQKELARLTFYGEQSPAAPHHTWSPLLVLKDRKTENGDGHSTSVAPAEVKVTGQGIALPTTVNGACSQYVLAVRPSDGSWSDALIADPKQALPTLLPPGPDGRLTLSVRQQDLLMTVVPKAGVGIHAARPDFFFLARCWVNGKPVLVKPLDPIPALMGENLETETTDSQFRLHPDLSGIGARRGDQIDVQLLYCPCGWVPTQQPQREEVAGKPEASIMTNRVRFTAL